jgi:UV DNA damage endonuclease
MNLGYCCINLSLKEQGISTNRGMIKKTFMSNGLPYAGELALLNLKDLFKILKWNIENNILVYRMSSDLFPWMSEYKLEQLPNFSEILSEMKKISDLVHKYNIRLSFHPGQFDVLASPNPGIVSKTIYDLDQHSAIMDYMCLPLSPQSAINIHIGGSYGDKESALARFCNNFKNLSDSTKKRLVVENDDKATQYGVSDLYKGVYEEIGCPITFDHYHHRFCTNNLSAEEASKLAASTWGSIRPLHHYSSSKSLYEDSSSNIRSHSDYIYEKIPHYGLDFDCELEVKMKDLALIKYLTELNTLPESPKKFNFE